MDGKRSVGFERLVVELLMHNKWIARHGANYSVMTQDGVYNRRAEFNSEISSIPASPVLASCLNQAYV